MASYDSVLKFTQKVLKNFNFHSSILTEDELESLDLDLGLRKKIAADSTSRDNALHFIRNSREHVMYFSKDCFNCHHTVMRLPGTDSPVYFSRALSAAQGRQKIHTADAAEAVDSGQIFRIFKTVL